MIKVLIVDDSLLVRKLLEEILSRDPSIKVVDTASDPYDAREKIKRHKPDVITLDVEMPKMNGIQFLSNLMRLHPLPVIMISTLTEEGADVTLKALELGAIDYIPKPKFNLQNEMEKYADELVQKVKAASKAKPRCLEHAKPDTISDEKVKNAKHLDISQQQAETHLIAIGSSTGGVEALHEVVLDLPDNLPGIVITQHIPFTFCERFAKRLNSRVNINVQIAKDNMPIKPGNIYVAPGNKHLMVSKRGNNFYCQLDDGPAVSMHKPSVDVMFDSVASAAGKHAIGIILTGMGKDGAEGLKKMLDTGANTVAQDEETSVVWGMPGTAVKLGAAEKQLPIGKIANHIDKVISDKLSGAKRTAA